MQDPPPPPILKRVVEAKLEASGALAHAKRAGFGSNPFGLANDNSLLLEFQGITADSKYRMLVSFLEADLLAPDVLRKIGRCRDLLQLDLSVFYTRRLFSPDEMYKLKISGIHALYVAEVGHWGAPFQSIPDFIHVPGLPYDNLLVVNLLANEITKRLRKKFHLVLSELAAASYDSYGTFATRDVMRFEDDLLRGTLDAFLAGQRGALAIDVGCGNGRHSRALAKYFDDVIAFDLSRRMIDAARDKDRRQLPAGAKPPTYYECDVEYEEFPEEDSLKAKADFVCASFGMPSFVEDMVGFVRSKRGPSRFFVVKRKSSSE